MLVKGKHYRTIWLNQENSSIIEVIDQRWLPHEFKIKPLSSVDEVVRAIRDMVVRGAGLIGVTAAYGMYLAVLEAAKSDNFDKSISETAEKLISSRPTAVNLSWSVEVQKKAIHSVEGINNKKEAALKMAENIANKDVEDCQNIGKFGYNIIKNISAKKDGQTVNILTHCNAGWLAFTDYGTATAPIYKAVKEGIDLHVWVDETRPRNQGAHLTAWELNEQKVSHSIISDNTGGHLMQLGEVDLVITGADRVTSSGDVANKIGTYLKALAANDNKVPFYVAFPSSTIDWSITEGLHNIPIEERAADEVKYVQGLLDDRIEKVLITPKSSPARNFGFDVTPSRLITGFITEEGVCSADENGLKNLFGNVSS